MQVTNASTSPVTLYRDTSLGRLHDADVIDPSIATVNRVSVASPCSSEQWSERIPGLFTDLDSTQQQQLHAGLQKNRDVFAFTTKEVGETHLDYHRIKTTGQPVHCKPRPIPHHQQAEVTKQLTELDANSKISRKTGPVEWGSPLVVARKKSGELRLCCDFRALNSQTVRDSWPLPRLDDILNSLSGADWFSSLDLRSGYHQLSVAPEDRHKTAVVTPFVCNGPSSFQRLMELTLAGMNGLELMVYLDDIVLFSSSFDAHLNLLQRTFSGLRDAVLTLHPAKCQFANKEVTYLGHIVSSDGLRPDPTRVKAITAISVPQSVQEARRFLGMCSFYRRFIRCFSSIARPLHQPTEKGRQFKWTTECEDAFNKLKEALVSNMVMQYPDFSRPFYVTTDASKVGLGAVLSQFSDGVERPVAYASRTVSKPESNYSATELEMLAVLFAKTCETAHSKASISKQRRNSKASGNVELNA